jgi:hypothetical protein
MTRVIFWEMVRALDLEVVDAMEADDPSGAFLLTRHGSIISMGAPDRDGQRLFDYRPGRPGGLGPVRGMGALSTALARGEAARIGRLRLSPIEILARDRAPRPAAAARAVGKALREYRLCVARLEAETDAAAQAVLEAEAMGLALHVQRLLAPEGGLPLVSVSSMKSTGGREYRVERDERDLALRRLTAGADEIHRRVRIEPQSVVIGAPLVIAGSLGLRCTGEMRTVRQAKR